MKVFRELEQIKQLSLRQDPLIKSQRLETITHAGKKYPIISFTIGSEDPTLPVFGLFGGVHGLEKVGTQLIISYLDSLFHQMEWDKSLREKLKTCRIVAIPLINPAGMATFRRSNGRGVDLMRNAPLDSDSPSNFLASGHRISPLIPWYRGSADKLETEAQVLVDFVQKELFPSPCALALDIHSGFGARDRLWFPYASSKQPFEQINLTRIIEENLNKTYPHHIYKIEQQSDSYLAHGDLWDWLYFKHRKDPQHKNEIFLPWTLEMGSWTWLRKNPTQLFSAFAYFNPIKQHRYERIMRRHILLLDFFLRMVENYKSWKDA